MYFLLYLFVRKFIFHTKLSYLFLICVYAYVYDLQGSIT
jgi:hypothetical protein